MKIIKQSFEPWEDTGDHIKNIARAARICYKSEDKAKEDETNFVKGIIKQQHNSCLEMSVIHLRFHTDDWNELCSLVESKYLTVDWIKSEESDVTLLCTGSIRAWREWLISNTAQEEVITRVYKLLNSTHALFFKGLKSEKLILSDYIKIYQIESQYIPEEIRHRHIHQAIKFITNRAVTHELVRHRPVAFLQESQRYCRYSEDKFGNEVTFIEPSAFKYDEPFFKSTWITACEQAERHYFNMLEFGASPQAARTVLPNSCKTEIVVYASLKQWEHIFAMRESTKAEPSMLEAIRPVVDWFIENFPEVFAIPEREWQRSIG